MQSFEESHCKWVSIKNGYKFINFMDTGTDGTAMILENMQTKQIRFILLLYEREHNKEYDEAEGKPKLKFE